MMPSQPAVKRPAIQVIDETIREGMQYRGVMFSQEQRLTMVDFQEKIGVEICQAGYPSAHPIEAQTISAMVNYGRDKQYRIRVAAMGRVHPDDVKILIDTGIKDFHLHLYIPPDVDSSQLNERLDRIPKIKETIIKAVPDAMISIALLDIGNSGEKMLQQSVKFCCRHEIDILSLPDTSGMMAPNQVYDRVHGLFSADRNPSISIHCHNDLGMASANSVMGILAGGRYLEASALGIGERNGIADLYTTAKALESQGIDHGLALDDVDTFKAYYQYVDTIVHDQTGIRLLWDNTPVFGDAVKTHVAGTHAGGTFASVNTERYDLNGLCGKALVKKYLSAHQIDCPDSLLAQATDQIKHHSYTRNRRLTPTEVKKIIVLLSDSG